MKRRSFLWTVGVLLLSLVLVLGACGGGTSAPEPAESPSPSPAPPASPAELPAPTDGVDHTQGDEVVLRVADTQPESTALVQHIRMFGDILEEVTDGRITVEIFPAGMMGPQPTVLQQLQMGALDILRTDAAVLHDFGVESMGVLGLPFLFEDKAHAERALYSELGDRFLQDIIDADIGVVPLGWLIEPPRQMFFRDARVETLPDMAGILIRTPENELFLSTMEAFGASATAIPMSDVYTSLQTGVVDAAENTLDTFNANRFDEVTQYITMTNHILNVCPMMISTITWNSLSDSDQQLLLDTWAIALAAYDTFAIQNDIDAMTLARDNGVEIIEVADRDAWIAAVASVHQQFGAGFEDVIQAILDMAS